MIEGIPKISVKIICYKQEELIKRAINSLLAQKDYIYEICVSDDCSPDRTWEVLQEYDRQYPGLFKLHRNEHNLGIFENIEQSWTMPTGDIVYSLAGDDECGEGWFKTVIEYIQKNKIDYKNELFGIYGDFKCVYPNGEVYTSHNNFVEKKIDKTYSAFRCYFSGRSACYSRNLLDKYDRISEGRSYKVESVQDIQPALNIEKYYYIPKIGNIYYAGIGVCTKMNDEAMFRDRLQLIPFTFSYLESKGYNISRKMRMYGKMINASKYYSRDKTFDAFIKYILYLILSVDILHVGKSLNLRFLLFQIFRRFSHSRTLNW